jgi:hypothetical protein
MASTGCSGPPRKSFEGKILASPVGPAFQEELRATVSFQTFDDPVPC